MKLEFIFPEKTTDEQKADFLHDLQSDTKSMDNAPYIKELDNNSVFDKIRNWAIARKLIEKGDLKTQTLKLGEEFGELSKAIIENNDEEIIDAIGDCVVVLTNLASLLNLRIEDCIQSSYNVISSRTGKMENGTFIKDK